MAMVTSSSVCFSLGQARPSCEAPPFGFQPLDFLLPLGLSPKDHQQAEG